ncbi:MAG: peptidoglycan editing factor PgeF [Prevotella sp.]|nr:peptidoglycan editing factor PgeF [Prevotella sp.]
MIHPELRYYDFGEGVVAFSSTRRGGYSKGNYGEFNINRYCGDEPQAIRQNHEALCQLLGISDQQVVMPHQVHLTKVVQIDEAFLTLSTDERQQRLEGVDALMTNVGRVCIGVSTADCIPVLLYDPEHQAICAIHAGWRGTVQRIVQVAIDQMIKAYGTLPQNMMAQIGPGISLDSFEVGDEVYEAFEKADFVMPSISRHDAKWHIDLPLCNRLQLEDSGIPTHQIAIASDCTFKQPDTWFSARRLGIQSGRIFTGIMLK